MADSDLHIINEGQESVDVVENSGDTDTEHPWPYLKSIFRYKGRQGNSVKLVCCLCSPLYKEICAYISSPSNLRKHVEVSYIYV
jgi:hypothetical protein